MTGRLPYVLIGIFFALLNIAMGPFNEFADRNPWASPLTYFVLGLMMSEMGVLAIWGLLGTGSFWKRLAVSFIVELFLAICLASGIVIQILLQYDESWGESVFDLRDIFIRLVASTILNFPLFLLAVQSPLWPLRFWFRWRIEWPVDRPVETHPLTIRNIMISTIVVAAILTAVRTSIWISSTSQYGDEPSVLWEQMAIMAVFSAGVSLPTTPTAVLVILRPQQHVVAGIRFFLLSVLAIVVTLAIVFVVSEIQSVGTSVGGMIEVGLTVIGVAVGLALPLSIARWQGYRLVWGKVLEREVDLDGRR